ncbi:MAG: hypothetical protein MI922_15605, partial [Bacteroidales bacterium]|nr:hypothetical protein [Bacteroidales bacterium]
DGSSIKRKAMKEENIANYNWVISPKLSNSRQPLNKEALKYWADKDFVTFKFIVRHNDDFSEITELVQQLKIKTHKVYLGLEGTEPKSQLNTNFVQKIIDAGFNFSPRLHVLFWGNERKK